MNNEQLKQEAIKKAYGGWYLKCNPNENGWSKEQNDFLDHLGETNQVEWLNYTICDFWRPKSLYGIENNNGWVRIKEDGSNLPTELTCCIVLAHNLEYHELWLKCDMKIKLWQKYKSKYTHYQPKIEPSYPIY